MPNSDQMTFGKTCLTLQSELFGFDFLTLIKFNLDIFDNFQSLLLVIASAQKSYCTGRGSQIEQGTVTVRPPPESHRSRSGSRISGKANYCVNCRKLINNNVGTKNKRRACKTLISTPNCCEAFFRPRTPLGKFFSEPGIHAPELIGHYAVHNIHEIEATLELMNIQSVNWPNSSISTS